MAKPSTKSKPSKQSRPSKKPKQSAYSAAIEAAIPTSGARDPIVPVRVMAAEAQRAAELAKPVRGKLAKLSSFEIASLDTLLSLPAVLVKVDVEWMAARAAGRSGTAPKLLKEADELKGDLFAAARFLLRKDAVVQERLDRIAEGTGAADTAADLEALAELVREFPEAFASDDGLPADAADRASALAGKIRIGTDPSAALDAQQRRNAVYWLVSDANAEVRTALRYLWRKDAKKLALLGLGYAAALRKTAKRKPSPKPA